MKCFLCETRNAYRLRSRVLLLLFFLAPAFFCLTSTARGMDLKRIEVSEAAAKRKSLIFLDARPVAVWRQGHIPGARFFSWETLTRTDAGGVKYRAFAPEELAAALGERGIRHTDAVVVYGDAETSWGGEGWVAWVLSWLGHQGPVYCLDGGFPLWQAKGLPVSHADKKDVPPAVYDYTIQPGVTISASEIMARKKEITLVDTRSYFTEWLPGHLPGAVHIPWEKFCNGPHRRFLSPEAVKALLADSGVDMRKPVVYYCTGGIRSGFAWMVSRMGGVPEGINFEGGTEEWDRFNKPVPLNH